MFEREKLKVKKCIMLGMAVLKTVTCGGKPPVPWSKIVFTTPQFAMCGQK